MKKVFLICPVRSATDEQKQKMAEYIKALEDSGVSVYYPARDTNQEDIGGGGWNICKANKKAIVKADEIHIFWDEKSTGSLFDLGIAFSFRKPLVIANPESIHTENGKSFNNLIKFWAEARSGRKTYKMDR
jgi:hypothetical protein